MSEQEELKHWKDYWSKSGSQDEVFTSSEGEKQPDIKKFWQSIFSEVSDIKVLDLASGAGSVFSVLDTSHKLSLTAVDASETALQKLNERIEKVKTYTCSVTSTPFDSATYQLVTSQFGLEYAGLSAFKEASRIVSNDGELICLVHHKDGNIFYMNNVLLNAAKLTKRSRFIEHAVALTKSAFTGSSAALKKMQTQFLNTEPKLAKIVEDNPYGIHSYIYLGFKKLYLERKDYNCEDMLSWLSGMSDELETTLVRLTSITKAAQDKKDMEAIKNLLIKQEFEQVSIKPFLTSNSNTLIAWALRAKKKVTH